MKSGSTLKPSVEMVFLNAKRAPVITITRRSTYPRGRSVGYIHDVLSDGRMVVVTARHVFYPEEDPNAYVLGLVDRLTTLTIERWFPSTLPTDDLLFLVVEAVRGFKPIIFGRPPNEEVFPEVVYNGKNTVGESRYPISLTAQKAGMKVHDDLVFFLNTETRREIVSPTNLERIAELRELGYSQSRLAQLYSRPGYSGSPIWDDNWNLYGVGVGGTFDHSERGDQVIYYPASYLDKVWADIKSANDF